MATATMDLFAGMEARDKGIEHAAECRNELVEQVRAHLSLLARSRGNRCVTADDFEHVLALMGKTNADLGNAAGVIFRTESWEFTGAWTPSQRKSNRARYIRVWRLK
jgi:hypothetical protein